MGNPEILSLTDDLTPSQFQDLLVWLWANKYKVSPASINDWRHFRGLK